MSNLKTNGTVSCSDCQLALSSGHSKENSAVEEHLQNCAECQEFARFCQDVLNCDLSVNKPIPAWTTIRREAEKRRSAGRRVLRIWLGVGSLAAAAAVAVTGFVLPMQLEHTPETPDIQPAYTLAVDAESLVNAWNDSSMLLAWDQAENEVACRSSMQDARMGAEQWSIELFNPYNEEI